MIMKKIRHNFNKGIKLHLACEPVGIRPVMSCIYFKDGYAIASNGKILIKACLNEICNFSEEEKELLEGKLISAKNFKEIIKHTIIEIEEDGFHAIYDDWDIKYKFATGDMKYPNYNYIINRFKQGTVEKILIDPHNLELIVDALDVSKGTRFHFPQSDYEGIKVTFADTDLLYPEAVMMPKLDDSF